MPSEMSSATAADTPERLGLALWRASLGWRRAMQQALSEFQLTLPEYLVLGSLVRLSAGGDEAPSQRELSDDAGLDPMTTSQAVRALEKSGLASREVDGMDARRWRVLPTRKAVALLKRAAPHARAASATFFAPLGAQLPRLGVLLRKLA